MSLHCCGRLSAGLVLACLVATNSAQVALVASAKSGASTLTADQAAALYLCKSDKVAGVGSLVLLEQAESSPVRELFYSKVLGKTPAQVKAAWTRVVFTGKGQLPKEAATSADVKAMLAANPDAIGYIEKSAVDSSVKVLLSVE